MVKVKSILDSTRQPRLAEDEMHTYDDKYALAEFLTNTSIAAQMNALERLGLDPSKIVQVMDWVHEAEDRSKKQQQVTLRFSAEDSCTFLLEQEVEMDTGVTKEIEVATTVPSAGSATSLFGSVPSKVETIRTKVLTKVKEYHWKVLVSYKIIIFPGTNAENGIELQTRSTETVLVTAAGTGTAGSARSTRVLTPLPERTIHPPIDTKLTWFIKMLSPKEQTCQFSIDREVLNTCKTPRRNDDVQSAVTFHMKLQEWSESVRSFFIHRIEKEINGKHNPVKKEVPASNQQGSLPLGPGSTGIMTGLVKEPTFNGKRIRIVYFDSETQRYEAEPVDSNSGLPSVLSIKPGNIIPDKVSVIPPGPPLSSIDDDMILCPILPLMEKKSVLDMGDVGEFLNEQSRAIDEIFDLLTKEYPPRQLLKQISVAEASIVLICGHLVSLTTQYIDSVDYIEHMLKTQLIQAIGKEIKISDFEKFLVAHNRKLFSSSCRPAPFSYAIRRPGFYPDGIVSIETAMSHQGNPNPIETFSRKVTTSATTDSSSIYIPINAGTSVEIKGDKYLHGWMQHRFESETHAEYNLACRARQFSCFIVLVGVMKGPDIFDATNAIIVQNKDEVLIPLLTNTIPSAKEFKDAIVSLSPEQQAFAKEFRNMQLESSVFGVCVIQIKPQLEALLGIPDCSLTKEIQLTQDLLSLFIDYQIPSDLLAFNTMPVESTMETSIVTSAQKVEAVKGYVKAVLDVIDSSKEKMLKEEEMKHEMLAEMKPVGSAGGGAGSETYIRMDGKKVSRRLGHSRTASKLASKPEYAVELSSCSSSPSSSLSQEDFTLLPKLLDGQLEKYDTVGSLRSTIVKAGTDWIRMRQANLLVSPKKDHLTRDEAEKEKKKAYDLLDAISRSGTLPIQCSELHILIAVSHCFDNDVIGCVIQDNINPIEQVERSSLILAAVVNSGVSPSTLIHDPSNAKRLTSDGSFPLLIDASRSETETSRV